MKPILYFLFICLLGISVASCGKDEGKLPIIEFRTGAGLISADATVAAGSTVTIGIHAEKAETQDVLKKFNISLSKNGSTAITVYDEDVSGADQDAFDFDFTPTLATLPEDNYKFTFTVTNRDGLTNNVSLTLTTN